jgi:tetratricopeptide (TPR) repeat protein
MEKKNINDFLSGKLNDHEHKDFQKGLAENENLLKQVGNEIINEYGRIKLKNKLNNFDKDIKRSRLKKANLLMVAVLCLAIGIPLLMNIINGTTGPDKLFASHFSPYKTVLSVRGNENNDELLSKGIIAYSTSNYKEAIESLEAIPDKSYVVSFYLGVSYLGVKPPKGKEAIMILNKVLTNDNDFKQQAIWYKALALLVTNETEKAKVLFEEIVTNEWFNHEKATEILEVM